MNRTINITNDRVTDYVQSLYRPLNGDLASFRAECEELNVPIILKETESFLGVILDMERPASTLEIGTAHGYSAVYFWEKMTAYTSDPRVFTIEKNPEAYRIAKQNIEVLGYGGISCHNGDGEEIILELMDSGTLDEGMIDFVFIDAAKSHNRRFLDAAIKVCHKGSLIIVDNTLFKAKVASDEYDKLGKHRTNIRNLREFNEYCTTNPAFSATVQAIGDGVTIIKLL